MSKLIMKNYIREYTPRMIEIQQKYTRLHHNASVVGEDVFNYPEFAEGKNILCAFDENDCLVGYTHLYPKPISDDLAPELPHRIWFELKVDVDYPQVTLIKNQLLAALFQRAREIAAHHSERPTLLCISKYSEEADDLDYLMKHDFQPYETLYTMRRNLEYPVSTVAEPEGVTIQQTQLSTEDEQQKYIQAYALAFPHSPMSREWLQYFVQSPYWSVGTSFTAFDPAGNIVGSALVYWNPKENFGVGITKEVFVTTPWRGKGIAKFIVKEALLYLQAHGLQEARLIVPSPNDQALTVYMTLGYEFVNQQLLLSRTV